MGIRISYRVLNEAQKRVLKNLIIVKNKGFYLAGGTALAMYLRHRTSLDFDFYNKKIFEPEELLIKLKDNFNKIRTIQIAERTLILEIDGVITSFFYYPYKLIEPFHESEFVKLASLEDISAMKIVSIIQRGNKRYFVDIYFLIKKFGLKGILEFAVKKYPEFSIYLALQALTYFDDAETDRESEKRIKLLKKFDWKKAKKFIIDEVQKYKDENLL